MLHKSASFLKKGCHLYMQFEKIKKNQINIRSIFIKDTKKGDKINNHKIINV